MNAQQYHRIKQVVAAALDLPSKQQSAYLDRKCGNDPDERAEADALLARAAAAPTRTLASSVLAEFEAAATVDAAPEASTMDHPRTSTQQELSLNIPGFQILKPYAVRRRISWGCACNAWAVPRTMHFAWHLTARR